MTTSLFCAMLTTLCVPNASAEDIHTEKSLYRNIVVKESSGRRCLVFSVKRGDRNQTCMDLANPRKLVFPYVQMTFAGLLVNDKPESILIIGLGGGSIPVTLAEIFPDSSIDIVEIDEAVVRVARKYFNFAETDRMKVFVSDARVYIKRAGLQKKQYDFIILDAFTGDYIPEHLMTIEFLQETRDLLSGDGVLVANTFSTSKLYHHESVTYQQVFGEFLNLKMPNTGNRVIVASIEPLPGLFELRSKSKRFSARMDNYGVNIEQYPKKMSREVDWDETKRALTDQFNPANLLQGDSY